MTNPASDSRGQVLLAQGESALAVLHGVLADAAGAFAPAFAAVSMPAHAEAFRRVYPDLLPQFEAARLASPQRHQIANRALTALRPAIVWRDHAGTRPLDEALREAAEPLPLNTHAFEGTPGWQADVVYRGERWESSHLADLGSLLVDRHVITAAGADALAWVQNELLEGGLLRLTGRKVAVLGGGAEMAPTRLWLEAGAEVLWLDTAPPPRSWWDAARMSGRLFWPESGADLLTQPREVLATLIDFADGSPLDLGLYAYAPGQARELRLIVAMNAMVDALAPELVGSVTLLVSPTTPAALSARDLAATTARLETRPLWEAVCSRLGLLGRGGGSVAAGDAAATRTVVSIQGASYQAAQYLGKVLAAECWSEGGRGSVAGTKSLRVSANTAAITRTRSIAHPVFTAAFGGAAAMGVETLSPRQSRRLNGLLAVRDWLHPQRPMPGSVRVHGGLHTLPYPLEAALRVAAAIGFARSPRLLRGLVGKAG